MKVLAIVASARKTGNSEILAKEMLAALPESVDKKLLRLPELLVEPCKACYACLPQGASCIIDDDFGLFLAEVRAADALIIASPVYFLGMHTRLKLLCDRLISVLNEGLSYAGRRCVVAVPYGVENWEGYGIEATVSFARFLHLDVVGVLPVRAANPGEVVRPEVLSQARSLAGRLLEKAGGELGSGSLLPPFQPTQTDQIACACCGSGIFRMSDQGKVGCVICGATGTIEIRGPSDSRKVFCLWNGPKHFRYSSAGMQEHGSRLESIKEEFLAKRHELAALRKEYKT